MIQTYRHIAACRLSFAGDLIVNHRGLASFVHESDHQEKRTVTNGRCGNSLAPSQTRHPQHPDSSCEAYRRQYDQIAVMIT